MPLSTRVPFDRALGRLKRKLNVDRGERYQHGMANAGRLRGSEQRYLAVPVDRLDRVPRLARDRAGRSRHNRVDTTTCPVKRCAVFEVTSDEGNSGPLESGCLVRIRSRADQSTHRLPRGNEQATISLPRVPVAPTTRFMLNASDARLSGSLDRPNVTRRAFGSNDAGFPLVGPRRRSVLHMTTQDCSPRNGSNPGPE